MRIGIDARTLGFSGIGRYTENLIRELLLIDNKNEYTIFVQKNGRNKNYELRIKNNGQKKFINHKSRFLNLKMIEVDAPIYSFKEQFNFLMAVNREKLDVMHFTHFNRPIFYNRPTVVTIHDLTPIYFQGKKHNSVFKKWAYNLVLKTALNKANKIIAVSSFTKKDIVKHFPNLDAEKIAVIYEGANSRFAPIFNSKFSISKRILKPYLLYVGVWREHKNLLGLIKAFNKFKSKVLNSQHSKLKLVIVGKSDPYYSEVSEAARRSKFSKDIILTGYVKDEELISLYQNAEAFVFPSFYEGFGLPPLEAMSFGCPVVSSNAASLPEILGDAALYFDPYNVNDITEKIRNLISDEKIRKELVAKGKKQVLKYSFKTMAEKTLKLYNEINLSTKLEKMEKR